ncbi:hypothetical protein L1285_03475 [Pseudoalteromonas sp. DL2-H2.2]|uniref:hypothetical protein n=1 Tax=Pseudoalteromonas sp. DL2-H2.2 TaxID=2908889 RepID=UPI001F36F337|nr:hypothetical protein [Pseudoalteromonas sp. DL2-H2.2]MCF2907375.1 hypothetical protein [Pseudoalteromonas sp. DL2-H2.2]
MKLKLNKKKMKTLSTDHSNLPANMTPQVAGGTDINSSYPSYRCGGGNDTSLSADGVTHCVAHTCGRNGCGDIL